MQYEDVFKEIILQCVCKILLRILAVLWRSTPDSRLIFFLFFLENKD